NVTAYNLSNHQLEKDSALSIPKAPLSWSTSVGFVRGRLVVVRDGILYAQGGEKDGQKVNELIPPEAKSTQWFPDIAAGEVRLQTWNSNEGKTDVVTLPSEMRKIGHQVESAATGQADNIVFLKSTDLVELPWTRSRRLPTLSDVSSYAAYFDYDGKEENESNEARNLILQS